MLNAIITFVKVDRQNRRQFFKKASTAGAVVGAVSSSWWSALATTSGMSAVSFLSSCASVDDYLFTDPPGLEDYVLIVGGGICGLYAGYQLKKRKIPYRIFEASSRLGGQILADGKIEYGGFEFSNEDTTLLKLCKELNIETEKLDKKNWTFKQGSEIFLNQLVGSVIGLLPDRQIRLKHKLVGIDLDKKQIRLNFLNEKKQSKSYTTHKAVIAMPVQNLLNVQGLVHPDLEFKVSAEKVIRVVIPIAKIQSVKPLPKGLAVLAKGQKLVREADGFAYEVRQHKASLYITFWNKGAQPQNFPSRVEDLEKFIAQEILGENYIEGKAKLLLQPENIYDWSSHPTIRISTLNQASGDKSFQILEHMPTSTEANLLIASDGLIKPMHRVENLIRTIDMQIDRFM